MHAILRNLLVAATLGLFSLTSTAVETDKHAKAAVKAEKKIQEAHTLDGKKPKACNFRISLS